MTFTKRLAFLLGLALVATPALAAAQGMEHEGQEMAHDMKAEHARMSEAVRPLIEARAAEWEEAVNAGDFAAVAALYTEDGVLYPPGSEAVEGRAAIQEAFAAAFGGVEGLQMDLETTEVYAVHGGALEIGNYTMSGADGHIDHGKYMVAWTETDDGWMMARDIWNSSMGGGD